VALTAADVGALAEASGDGAAADVPAVAEFVGPGLVVVVDELGAGG
jgi:hypothetical protein